MQRFRTPALFVLVFFLVTAGVQAQEEGEKRRSTDRQEADRQEADRPDRSRRSRSRRETDRPETDRPETDRSDRSRRSRSRRDRDRPETDRPETDRPERGRQRSVRDPAAIFDGLDKNSDGKVTADEIDDERRRRFFESLVERADANKDGALTREEFVKGIAAGRPGERDATRDRDSRQPGADSRRRRPTDRPSSGDSGNALFTLLDRNRDGKLSTEEIAAAARILPRLDRDGDGSVSLQEVTAVRRRGSSRGDSRRDSDGRSLLQRLDTDKDGKISKDEARGPFAENFDRIDRDSDGKISEEELNQVRRRGTQRRREADDRADQPSDRRSDRGRSDRDRSDRDRSDRDRSDRDRSEKRRPDSDES